MEYIPWLLAKVWYPNCISASRRKRRCLISRPPIRLKLAPQHRPHPRISLGCVIDFENAELKFVRLGRAVAGVNCATVD
jgi:hypothetical protein